MAKKLMTTLQLMQLAIFSFGLQFSNSLLLANLGSLFKFLGAHSETIALLGLAAPISGLIIQPIIGQLSDDTLSRYGKRKPYLFFWGSLAFIACLLLPFTYSLSVAFVLIWILSCSVNGAVEAQRALTGDIVSSKQQAEAFSLQTIFAGVGAGVAGSLPFLLSYIPRMSISKHSLGIPLAIKISFFVAALLICACLAWTLMKINEEKTSDTAVLQFADHGNKTSIFSMIWKLFANIFINLKKSPDIIKKLGLIQVFTWMGLYGFWMYFSMAIAQHLYGLSILADLDQEKNNLILQKASLVSNFYFSVYQYTSIVYASLLILLSRYYPQKMLHGYSLVLGAIGLWIFCLFHSNTILFISMILIGLMWGSIMTLPYSIVASEIPKEKMGIYFGIFNISITLPQILSGLTIPMLYEFIFFKYANLVLVFSALLIFTGGFFTIYFFYNDLEDKKNIIDYYYYYQKAIFFKNYTIDKIKTIHASHYVESEFDEKKKRIILLFIILLMIASQIASTIYLPSMPIMADDFHIGRNYIFYSLTFYFIGYGFSQFIYGPLSDFYGRRIIVITGLLIFTLFSLLLVFSTNIYFFLFSRFFQGVGIGCGDTMGRAILCDKFKNHEFIKAACHIGFAAVITPLIAPILGGYIGEYYNWRYNFLIIFSYGLLVFIFIFNYFPETHYQRGKTTVNFFEIFKNYFSILTNKAFLVFFVPGLVCFSGETIYSLLGPFLIQNHLGWSPSQYGWLSLYNVSGFLVGTLFAQLAGSRLSYAEMVFYGTLILVIASILMFIFGIIGLFNVFVILFPMAIFMMGVGITYPNTNMGALTPFAQMAGSVGALQGGLQMILGGILSSFMSGVSLKNQIPLAVVLLSMSFITFSFFYYFQQKKI